MPVNTPRTPKYRHHKPSGLAVVRLSGRDIYLGPFDTPESRSKYDQVVADWLANGRRLDVRREAPESKTDFAMCELMLAYLEYAKGYYVKNGRQTGEATNIQDALRPVMKLYSKLSVTEFGPRALKTVREAMVMGGLARKCVNGRVNRIRRMFRWGVAEELVAPTVLQALQAVAPLKKGRSAARETAPVRPVPDEHIEAVLATVTSTIRAMIEVQRLTGMRPGELVMMRPCDIDQSGRIWTYQPASHKTEHHEIDRQIFLGPKAQMLLQPFMRRDAQSYLFNPHETILERRKEQRMRSKKPGVRERRSYSLRSLRRCQEHYTTDTYYRAIARACERAGIPVWGPNRLRHNAATLLRKQFGIEAARVILGHTSSAMTEVYAELDRAKAADIMARVG